MMSPRLFGALAMSVVICTSAEQAAANEKEMQELRARIGTYVNVVQKKLELKKSSSTVYSTWQTTERRLDAATLSICLDYMWLLICGALVMFMQAGFAILEAGSVTNKNSGLVLLKNLVDGCLGTISWYFLGYGIAYGLQEDPSRFAGGKNFAGNAFLEIHGEDNTIIGTAHFKDWFFQWAFCATAATIVSGGVAERMAFPAYVLYSVIMTGVIYPFVVYWTWSGSGWLSVGSGDADAPDGYSDFAGSGIVHLVGGTGALVGAALLGPRQGRFERPDEFKPCNASMVVLGTFILWFGWYGFNCGSTLTFSDVGTASQAGLVAMNTTLSAAAGGITVFVLRLRTKTFDMCGMCNGILAGLVAICAGVGNMDPMLAMVTGMLGAVASEIGHVLVQFLLIDDPLDAFAVHGCGGMMGLFVRPLFDRTGIKGTMLGWHCIGIVAIVAWVVVLSLIIMLPLKLLDLLRISKEEEKEGGDSRLAHSPAKPYENDNQDAQDEI